MAERWETWIPGPDALDEVGEELARLRASNAALLYENRYLRRSRGMLLVCAAFVAALSLALVVLILAGVL